MRQRLTLADGARAAEDLASALLGFSVHKAVDPLSPSGFLLIGQAVAEKLKNAAKGAEAEAVAGVIHRLGFDWAKLAPDAATRAMNAVNKAIGDAYEAKVLPKISDVLEIEGPKVMKGTKKSVVARQRIEIATSLAQRDLQAEKAIRKSQVNFIRDSTGRRVALASVKARSIVAIGVRDGVGTDQISKDLRTHFDESIPRPESYWRTVADSFVGRARTTSQVYSYEDAGVETIEVVAVLDEVTTDQCRFMDGKVFTVQAVRSLLDALSSLESAEDVKFASPWIRKGRDSEGGMRLFVPHADGATTTIAKIDRSGVGAADDRGAFSGAKNSAELSKLGVPCPPFHGRCRTTTVASSEAGVSAPVMVPGADLQAPVAAIEEAPLRPPPPAVQIPDWMTADELNVVSQRRIDGGMTGARQLTIKDANGTEQRAVWKAVSGEDVGEVLRKGVEAGTYYQREGAAYQLDSMLGSGTVVPPTVSRKHKAWSDARVQEEGSLQAFVQGAKPTSNVDWKKDAGGNGTFELGAELEQKLANDPDVRRQFLLDVIMANDDRHSENTLWRTVGDSIKPVAIDNGLSFPEKPCRFLFAVDDAPVLKKALMTFDEGSIANLAKLDVERVATMLKSYDGITETQITATLGRIRALQNGPGTLAAGAEPWEQPQDTVYYWLTRTPAERAKLGELTEADLAEITKLAKR